MSVLTLQVYAQTLKPTVDRVNSVTEYSISTVNNIKETAVNTVRNNSIISHIPLKCAQRGWAHFFFSLQEVIFSTTKNPPL